MADISPEERHHQDLVRQSCELLRQKKAVDPYHNYKLRSLPQADSDKLECTRSGIAAQLKELEARLAESRRGLVAEHAPRAVGEAGTAAFWDAIAANKSVDDARESASAASDAEFWAVVEPTQDRDSDSREYGR